MLKNILFSFNKTVLNQYKNFGPDVVGSTSSESKGVISYRYLKNECLTIVIKIRKEQFH